MVLTLPIESKRITGAFLAVLLIASALFALTPGSSLAEIYRWQDDDGNWHFSDSPTSDALIQQPPEASIPSAPSAPQPEASAAPVTETPPKPTPASSSGTRTATATQSASAAATVQGGLFWQVSKNGLQPSYLLGTIHSADSRVVNLRSAVSNALDQADQFVMEMQINANALMQFGATMMITDGNDLEALLGQTLYRTVVEVMTDYGLPEMAVRQLKPWVVMALLSMPKSTGGPILDMVLYQRAISQEKPTSGLESIQEQLAVFEGLTLKDQIDLLQMTVDQLPSLPRMFEQLIQAYLADDLQKIAALASQYKNQRKIAALNRFMLRLNDERNRRMVQRIQPYLHQGNAFVAVGALHLAGPNGLVQLLRDRGYQLDTVGR